MVTKILDPVTDAILTMGDFRQKEKKKLPHNKPSRDEPCLSRCNTSSMVLSADPRNMAALTQFISVFEGCQGAVFSDLTNLFWALILFYPSFFILC